MTLTIDQEDDEKQLLRKSVSDLANKFGHTYFRELALVDGRAHELWEALADGGFTSVNLPAEFGGGGAGITELTIVCEEVAAARHHRGRCRLELASGIHHGGPQGRCVAHQRFQDLHLGRRRSRGYPRRRSHRLRRGAR